MSRQENDTKADARSTERSSHDIETKIQIFDDGQTWNESAQITSLSRNGAGFSTARECTVGRLIKMEVLMPPELRAYDESEDIYPVMGIVQHCNCVSYNGENIYQVGVALIGKEPPVSFENDPLQNYRISGMSENGLWNITDVEKPFKGRTSPRFSVEVDVTLALIQTDKRLISKQDTFTKNISAGGASVVSTLKAKVGDKIKFACKDYDFYAIACVRNRHTHLFDPPTLHLEFMDRKFPVERLPNNEFAQDQYGIEETVPPSHLPVPSVPDDGPNFEFERFQL